MLKIKETKEGMTAERVSFSMPVYIKSDDAEQSAFRLDCYGLADKYLLSCLEDKENDSNEQLEKKQEKRNAVDGLTESTYTEDRLVKAFCQGLDFIRMQAVPGRFADIYDNARRYARKYRESTTWEADRKEAFTTLKSSMESFFTELVHSSEYGKEDFTLKLSSKAVNTFIASIYHFRNTNGKELVRGTKYVTENIYKSFCLYMQAVNTCTGVSKNESKETVINVY